MTYTNITTDNTLFVLLSFEGPDLYSLAGGLGVRVANLSGTLASMGFPTHLFFIGAPGFKGEETCMDGKLTLHRWCQWISEHYLNGVYHGENEKFNDFNQSIPAFVAERVVRPAVKEGKLVVVLGEEWQTAEAMCRLSDKLYYGGIRDRAVMFWNANNTYGFNRINWKRLAFTTTLTTVSQYMKQIMGERGLDPIVIPNGIPRSLLNSIDSRAITRLKRSLNADLVLSKVARFDPDKRWNMAVEATAELKARGKRTVLLARGGMEPHENEVLYNARSLGLTVREARSNGDTFEDYCQAIANEGDADIINIKFHCPQDFLRVVYHNSDAVLANSGHEPFGLVGLETMAAGGMAFTGGTGEDYAIPLFNSIVVYSSDPGEIVESLEYLQKNPAEDKRIRLDARQTARDFTWERVIAGLIQNLEHQARIQGLLAPKKA